MRSPKIFTKANWSWKTFNDKRIYTHRNYNNMHVTVYFNGDYHSTYKNRHFGYVDNRFQISGGKQQRELFLQFEEDVKSERVSLPSVLKMNIEMKIRRQCDKITPVENVAIKQSMNRHSYDGETKKRSKRKRSISKKSRERDKSPTENLIRKNKLPRLYKFDDRTSVRKKSRLKKDRR